MEVGEDLSPLKPINWFSFFKWIFSLLIFKISLLFSISILSIFFQLSFSNEKISSRKFLTYTITFSARSLLNELPFSPGITSVPYRESYKLPQRALAAFNAYLALSTGTTSCGPAIFAISSSTLEVSILKLSPSSTM